MNRDISIVAKQVVRRQKMVNDGTWQEMPKQLCYLNEKEVQKALDETPAAYNNDDFGSLFAGDLEESNGSSRKRKRYYGVSTVAV